jgi:hypothetical protein
MENLPNKKSAGDTAREVGKAILSATPIVGGPLQVLFENILLLHLKRGDRLGWNNLLV